MTRRTPGITLLLCLACAAGAPAATPEADARTALAQQFGEDLAKAKATRDAADDVALAGRILEKARSGTASEALTALLCEHAYGLAVGREDGFRTAVDAMTLLAETFPDRRDDCRDKIINAHQQRYNNSRGRQRIEAGEDLVRAIVRFADEQVANRQFAEAARLYRRGMPLSANLRSISHDRLKAKLDYAQTRQAFLHQAERLKTHLQDRPDDQQARDKLLRIYVVEFDDPTAAADQLDLQQDDPLNKYILLAGMSLEKLPLPALAVVGHWYRELAAEASRQGRLLAMKRARTYYQQYLKRAEPDADQHAAVQKGLTEANDALAEVAAALPIITIVSPETFQAQWAERFPPANNVAACGKAEASSHWGDRLPKHVFGGDRTGTAWSLDGPRGWFYAEWEPPAHGRYLLVFARGGAADGNPWGRAELRINETTAHRLADMTSGKVLVVDLGLDVPVKSLRLMIRGTTYPGLAGIEVHPDKKADPPDDL